jgi:N-acyl-D-aspartate/D-glutamate deacylase
MAKTAQTGGNLLVRGGVVVDGTGEAPIRADVRTADGRIVEVGPDLRRGEETEIDASGAYVTPGLIESHTHYDAAVWWDPDCDPMPAHGCTTMVVANCGLGLAPLRPDEQSDLVDLFAFIEDIPAEAFHLGVPWTWDTWSQYHQQAKGHATAVNTVGFFPHQMVRTWVMGSDAWERPATDTERAALCHELDEALVAGAIGLSTTAMDVDRNNRHVPSRLADDRELHDLIGVLARHDAVLQFVPRFLEPKFLLEDVERVARPAAAAGVRTLFAGYQLETYAAERRQRLAEFLAPYWAEGAPLWANFSVRAAHVNMHFERSIMWSGIASWHEVVNAPPERKRSLLADASWRSTARSEWDACVYTLAPIRMPQRLLLIGGPHSGESLADAMARTGGHPSDLLAEWLLQTDLEGNLRTADQPMDLEASIELIQASRGLSGASDAGAHVQMFSGAGDATYVLSHLVRDEGALTIEEAVHAVTAKQAAFFGIPDRGVVRNGAAADLAIFDLAEINPGKEVRVRDLPGGAWRYSRTPAGYRATIVAGVPTWLNGESTGNRPGSMVGRHRQSDA